MDQNFANEFYGVKPAESQSPAPNTGDFLSGGTTNTGGIVAGQEDVSTYEGGLHRPNLEGGAPTTYDPILNSFFEGREYMARFDKDELQIEALAATRAGANEVLRAFEVGETGAKEIFDTFNNYLEYPRSEETIEAMTISTEQALKKEFGHDYDKMVGAAKRVLQEAAKKIPNLIETVNETGIGSDLNFVRRLVFIGKRRGFAK